MFGLASLDLRIPDDHQLLAVATIALDAEGNYSLHIANVQGADVQLLPAQQAQALRILATGVEAETIWTDSPAIQSLEA